MRIRFEIDEQGDEEVIIRLKQMDERIGVIQQALSEVLSGHASFPFYQNEKEFYFPLSEILFFETQSKEVMAHTKNQVYTVKHRLYELEELLPVSFLRVSKSTIVNVSKILSIDKNLTGASEVEFADSYKKIFVSRGYYKVLKEKMESRRYRV
ncbi:transcriptional regulator, LytTR family [Lachnospiraceae bacterium XBB1006]|nr:transcriptional regulator, LytTR family [Lachnospiraceae bacterium XBB1006]